MLFISNDSSQHHRSCLPFSSSPCQSPATCPIYRDIGEQVLQAMEEGSLTEGSARTALMQSAEKGYQAIIEHLLKNDSSQRNHLDPMTLHVALRRATKQGDLIIMQRLLESGRVNNPLAALFEATARGHVVAMRILVPYFSYAVATEKFGYVFEHAVRCHQIVAAKWLMQTGYIDLARHATTCDHLGIAAINRQDMHFLWALWEYMSHEAQRIILLSAAQHNEVDLLHVFLTKNHATPNFREQCGDALYVASEHGHLDIIVHLLQISDLPDDAIDVAIIAAETHYEELVDEPPSDHNTYLREQYYQIVCELSCNQK